MERQSHSPRVTQLTNSQAGIQAVRAARSSYRSLVLCPDYLAFDGTPKNVHLRIAARSSSPRSLLIVKLSSVQKITRVHRSEQCHKETPPVTLKIPRCALARLMSPFLTELTTLRLSRHNSSCFLALLKHEAASRTLVCLPVCSIHCLVTTSCSTRSLFCSFVFFKILFSTFYLFCVVFPSCILIPFVSPSLHIYP